MSDQPQTLAYYEYILVPEDKEFIANSAEVHSDEKGYFIFIERNDARVMMTLPCAVKVHRALGKAIRSAKSVRKEAARAKAT